MSHLDPAPMLEYIEKLRNPKKIKTNDDELKAESKAESKHESQYESQHESQSESSRTNEAAAKDFSEMSSPTPSPAQKSETSTFTVTLPAAQFVMCLKLMTLFKTSIISSARATAGSIRSISSAHSARATAGSIRSISSARATAGSIRSLSGKSICHAPHDGSDITEDLSSDDESDAAGEVWVTPKTGKEDQQRGEATTKNDEGSPSALTDNNTTTAANEFTRAASPIASESGQYPAPVGAKRHAVVYTRSELMQIGREYRNDVLASLADCVGEKKLGLAVISAGKGGDMGLVSGS
ncbi:MAG: hypothetical protein LQ350_002267 [Teloschistes chrysophthalmus]|nr:MAG: hypothetical protein LQ350_002267 [Niorma chrysophthalma]